MTLDIRDLRKALELEMMVIRLEHQMAQEEKRQPPHSKRRERRMREAVARKKRGKRMVRH